MIELMDNRRRQFDSIGARRVVIPARPVATPPPIRTEVYRTTTQHAKRGSFGGEFSQLLRQYAPVLLAIVIGIPLVLTGSSFAMRQMSNNRIVAVSPDNSDIPSVSLATASSQETKASSKELQALVDKLAKNARSEVYISVRDLKTGAIASTGGNTSITSASLYKLFVANQIYRQIDAGKLSLKKVLPRGKTVEQCLEPMITVSDNPCGAQLGDLLGWGKQDVDLQNQGYNGTSLDDLPRTSSNDVALLLARLYANKLLSAESNEAFLNLLKDQTIVNRLPQGLPSGTEIAHKTGDLYGYMHDAGIVYGPKTDYVISIMSGPWDYPAQAPADFEDISQQVWEFFKS
jgi:beta-lactamase class A